MNPFSKQLRQNSTDAERKLWSCLRNSQLEGFKFRRQAPIGKYIVDFVCLEKCLIVEVDGGQHAENIKDKERDSWLESEGYKVIRFWNKEVLAETNGVLEVIRKTLLEI